MSTNIPTPTAKVTVIKKREKEKSMIDELLQQLEAEKATLPEESSPMEITEQATEKMKDLMDTYNEGEKKMAQVKVMVKQITARQNTILNDLKTMMRLYGLKNLIRGDREFVLDEGSKKKAVPKIALKAVMMDVIGDQSKVDQIFEQADRKVGERFVSKVKSQAYKGD